MRLARNGKHACQTRVLYHLHDIEDADGCEVSGQSEFRSFGDGVFNSLFAWLKMRAADAANRVRAGRNRDARVQVFGFEQTVVCGLKFLALDVETGERETLARCFFRVLGRADLTQPFSQLDGTRAAFKRGAKSVDGAFRRLILDEQ